MAGMLRDASAPLMLHVSGARSNHPDRDDVRSAGEMRPYADNSTDRGGVPPLLSARYPLRRPGHAQGGTMSNEPTDVMIGAYLDMGPAKA